jgi:hypothetical protein
MFDHRRVAVVPRERDPGMGLDAALGDPLRGVIQRPQTELSPGMPLRGGAA